MLSIAPTTQCLELNRNVLHNPLLGSLVRLASKAVWHLLAVVSAPFVAALRSLFQNSTTTFKMSKSVIEDNFEWIETPPARSPAPPPFDCGVRTTSVSCKILILPRDHGPTSH